MESIEKHIRNIEDFPKKGVSFKDITPLLADYSASKNCLEQLLSLVPNQKIDKVVGIEARGFFFAMLLAQELNVGFVPVRKPNKLPYEVVRQSYSLEYGKDVLEMHKDAIKPNEKCINSR